MSANTLILEGDSYHSFIDSVGSKYTRQMYKHVLKRYMSFCGVIEVNDLFFKAETKYIQSRIIDFLKFLRDIGIQAKGKDWEKL